MERQWEGTAEEEEDREEDREEEEGMERNDKEKGR